MSAGRSAWTTMAAVGFGNDGTGSGTGDRLVGILVTLLVCVLAYLATRLIAGHLGGRLKTSGRPDSGSGPFARPFADWIRPGRRREKPASRIEIVERIHLGRDRQILLLKVGHSHCLAGIGTGGIEFGPVVPLEPQTAAAVEPATVEPAAAEQAVADPAILCSAASGLDELPVHFASVLAERLGQVPGDRFAD